MAQNKTKASKEEIARQNENARHHDRVLWSTVLFAAGVLAAAFTLIKGESLWNTIHNIFLGLFGVTAFLVPIVMIYASIMIAMGKTELYVSTRLVQCGAAILLLTGFVQIFFAGELVDIDGKCGGYNLQWAWSSGVVAAKSAFDYCNRQE